MAKQLTNPTVMVNNVIVPITPNSLTYTEGLGEQSIRSASSGGNQTEQIYSRNVETEHSTIKFDMPAIVDNIKNARAWKKNENANVISITGATPEGNLSRTFTQAGLLTDVEIALGTDTDISLEFKSNPAI